MMPQCVCSPSTATDCKPAAPGSIRPPEGRLWGLRAQTYQPHPHLISLGYKATGTSQTPGNDLQMGDGFQLKVKVFGLGSHGGRETQDKTYEVWCCSGHQELGRGYSLPEQRIGTSTRKRAIGKGLLVSTDLRHLGKALREFQCLCNISNVI